MTTTSATRTCFLDTETTGLNVRDGHRPWEFGLIVRDSHGPELIEPDREFLFMVEPNLKRADPTGMRINGYYKRVAGSPVSDELVNCAELPPMFSPPRLVAAALARLLNGSRVIGALPSFDTAMLGEWLPENGQAGTWYYHTDCVETFAAGYLLGRKGTTTMVGWPHSSDRISRAIGVDPDRYLRHSALGDARWVRDQWDVMNGVRPFRV